MKAKVLTAITVVAVPALMLSVFSTREDGTGATDQSDETFVERAVRTRLNADIERTGLDISEETLLERAVRTRASELVERIESQP